MFIVVTRRGFIVIMPRPPPNFNCLSAGDAPPLKGGASPSPSNTYAPAV